MPLFPIHHTFAPHVDAAYALHALGLLLQPWRWRHGRERELLRQDLERRFGGPVFLFATGREGLLTLLRSAGITDGEVIVQAYTCVVVPNAIHAAGAVPVYADVDPATLTASAEDVARCMGPATRAVIAQHTFGIPSDMPRLRQLCSARGIVLVEDCAHALPDRNGPGEVGAQGDVLLLSFGRDKAISGVTGGAIICRNPQIARALEEREAQLENATLTECVRWLLYPLVYASARPFMGTGLGKVFVRMHRALGTLPVILEPGEKSGNMSPRCRALPNACASLARRSLRLLERSNARRRELTRFYRREAAARGWPVIPGIRDDLPLQKFPLFVQGPDTIRRALKTQNIHLEDGWTGCVICPRDVEPSCANYTPGSDPTAERIGAGILSLPTHPTMTVRQARRLVEALDPLVHGKGVSLEA